MLMPLDSTRLRGMTPLDREQAVRRLAALLVEAAETACAERNDDGR
jgi:hypothetical protein